MRLKNSKGPMSNVTSGLRIRCCVYFVKVISEVLLKGSLPQLDYIRMYKSI